jgi:glycine/serine hydroxymethyltransferase
MKEAEMEQIFTWIDGLITQPENEDLIKRTGNEVEEFARQFPLFSY